MSKRKRKPSLKDAGKVGWLAEIPDDLWPIIAANVKLDHDMVDLGFLLRLISCSKRMFLLFQKRIIKLLLEFVQYNKPHKLISEPRGTGDTVLFGYATYVFWYTIRNKVDLMAYVEQCTCDAAYQTVEHLSNSLSLIHFAYLEGRYLRPFDYTRNKCDLSFYERFPTLNSADRFTECSSLMYFNVKEKRAYRFSLLGCVMVKTDFFYGKDNSLYNRAKNLLGDNKGASLDQRYNIFTGVDNIENRILIVQILAENGEVIKRVSAPRTAYLEDAIVTIDGKQHHFLSKEAAEFRSHCFVPPTNTIKNATYAYLLDLFHVRNWDILTKTDRFHVK